MGKPTLPRASSKLDRASWQRKLPASLGFTSAEIVFRAQQSRRRAHLQPMQQMDPSQPWDPAMIMEEKIGLYPDLSPTERQEVEDYVDRHPHLQEALAEMRRVDRAFREGTALAADSPDDEALAFAAVASAVDAARLPPALRKVLRRLEQRIEADPELRARYRTLQHRREELEASVAAGDQFQRLIERDPEPVLPSRLSAKRPNPTNAVGRDIWMRLRRVVAAAVVVASIYAGLFAVGRIVRPEVERLARFDESELVVQGYDEVRGRNGGTDISEQTARYLDAIEELRAAERSFLGLFPTFDAERLSAGASHLRQVIEQEPEESFLAGEAAYLLGKTELARGNLEEARSSLQRAAASNGPHADDAERILAELAD